MNENTSSDAVKTNTVFLAIIAVILVGTAFWFFLTIWAAEPVAPDVAKEFAEDFERECFLELHDEEECKKRIGKNHLECIAQATERPDDSDGEVRHDRHAYMECMGEATGIE